MDIDEVTPFRYRWYFADPAEAIITERALVSR
jgi:hypothetical protein